MVAVVEIEGVQLVQRSEPNQIKLYLFFFYIYFFYYYYYYYYYYCRCVNGPLFSTFRVCAYVYRLYVK